MVTFTRMVAVLTLIGAYGAQYAWEYQPELMESSTTDPYLISSTSTTTKTPSSSLKTTTKMPFFLDEPDYTAYFEYEEISSSTTAPSETFKSEVFSTKFFATKIFTEPKFSNTEMPLNSGISIFLYVIIAGIFIFFVGLVLYCIFCCKECKMLGANYIDLNRTGNSFLLESRGNTELEVKDETLINLPRDGRYTATNMNYPGPSGLSQDEKPSKYI